MVFDYRAIVIPAALLSPNPADFRRLVYSFSQRFKLPTDTFKGPDETQEPGFRPKHCRNDDLTPGNVKLWESPGRAGGLPCYLSAYGPAPAPASLTSCRGHPRHASAGTSPGTIPEDPFNCARWLSAKPHALIAQFQPKR